MKLNELFAIVSEGQDVIADRILHQSDVIELLIAALKDSEPVVRCRECKHRGGYHCPMYHTETNLDDLDGFDDYNVDRTDSDGFCHRGERREQNESE